MHACMHAGLKASIGCTEDVGGVWVWVGATVEHAACWAVGSGWSADVVMWLPTRQGTRVVVSGRPNQCSTQMLGMQWYAQQALHQKLLL